MPKQYRVVSQAAAVKGRSPESVIQALGRLGMKPDQAQALLEKSIVIKKDLDNPRALQYVEKFTAAGLMVKVEAYEGDVPVELKSAQKQQDDLFAQLNQAFAQPLAANVTSREYQKSFVLAVITSLVAPLIYGGMVALVVGVLIWYFTVGLHSIVDSHQLHGKLLLLYWVIGYVTPAVMGTILLLFLLYPFWPQGKAPKPYELDRKKNKKLYQLVDSMAQAIGVPAPQHIRIAPEVNAAAGSANGMTGLLKGELYLMLGLSLVAGTTVQQLLGIIAHEFGHFSQRNAMLAYHWINRVSRWLHLCGYGDDIWLKRLAQWKEQFDVELVHISLTATEWMIVVVRTFFRKLFDLNLRLTRPMSQQMEFDADLYEARVVGSEQFRASTMALRKMSIAWQSTLDFNFNALNEKDKLLRNLPAAVLEVSNRLPAEWLQQLENDLQVENTEYWHTHPADQARIENAERANAPGIVRCDLPAPVLFEQFDKLCENSTLGWYLSLGIGGAREFMTDNANLLQAAASQSAVKQAAANTQQQALQDEARSNINENGMIEWTGSGKQ